MQLWFKMVLLDQKVYFYCFLFVLVYGTSEGFFKSTRDLRQGDPLLLLLFDFVMATFSKMNSGVMEGGFLSGFSVVEANFGSLLIPQLLFADALIFCGANYDQIQTLSALLLCFEAVLVMKVNLAKS